MLVIIIIINLLVRVLLVLKYKENSHYDGGSFFNLNKFNFRKY